MIKKLKLLPLALALFFITGCSFKGPQGEKGLSAYEIYLKYYPTYKGSEKEWIDDLSLGVLNDKYTITWTDIDGTILEIDNNVSRREIPEYNGTVPSKNGSVNLSFNGWSPIIEPATCDITYIAQYTSEIPNNVTRIEDNAYSDCSSLTSIVIPNSVTSIGNNAFSDCSSLTSIVVPNSVTSIGKNAFAGCSSIQFNEYGNCLYLGNEENPYLILAKAKDNTITEATISNNTRFILSSAFFCCNLLTKIIIPNNVTSISNGAFFICTSLTIYCEASSQPSEWDSGWNGSNRPVIWGYSQDNA